jgi:hypothetical protein
MNRIRFKAGNEGQASRLPGERVSASSRIKLISISAGFADGGQAGRLAYFQQ